MKRICQETQNTILNGLRSGLSVEAISKQSGRSVATVSRLRKKFLSSLPRQPSGRPKILSDRTMHDLKRKMLTGELKNGAAVHKYLRRQGKDIAYQTVLNNLQGIGFHAKKKTKKPFLSRKHMAARFAWARAHRSWTVEDWKRVIFSDETKINIWNSDGIQFYWTRPGDPQQPFHLQPTVKHGGGSLMFWGCMTWQGLGYGCKIYEGSMKKDDYIHILDTTLKESLEHYGYQDDEYIFQHDNDPKHTAKATKRYLEDKKIEVLPWPAQSADLNPIENIWYYLKVQIGRRERKPTSIHELWNIVLEEWERIPLELIQNLYESMPKRVEAVYRARGGNTKY